jgi:hypothetical protein
MSVCDCCNLQGTVRIQGSVEGPVAWSDYHLAKLLAHLTAVFSWPIVLWFYFVNGVCFFACAPEGAPRKHPLRSTKILLFLYLLAYNLC